MTKFVNSNTASTSSLGTLPSNTIASPKNELKAIITRSGVSYDGPQISPPPSSLPKVVENEPKTGRALIDVFKGELTLRVGKEAITFNLDQTLRYSTNYSDMTAKRINVIDMACEQYSHEVLGFSDTISSGNPTPYYDLIVSTTSLTLTPFGNSDFLLEEEKTALITVLKSHKRAITWKLSDIKDINPEFCTHKILMEEDFKPAVQHQRRVNPKIHDVIKQEEFSGELAHTDLIPSRINKAFNDDHVKEISSGSTTTHFDSSLYDSFIFDLSINPFPPADRGDFMSSPMNSFTSYLHQSMIVSSSRLNLTRGDFTMDVVEDISPTREPRVHNALPTHPTLQLNLEFKFSSESLFTYVVWIFLPFLLYSVSPKYLISLENKDTIFDPGICSYHISYFLPDVSHRSGTFI
nr:reverse transcriptase domain-containing protein [Tanacetum cinerariifolium]